MILNRRAILVIVISLITALALSGCQKQDPAQAPSTASGPITKSGFLLGTVIELTIYDKSDETILDKGLERIAEIENKMTINNADTSEIIALNNASGVSEVKLSPDTFYVVEKGKEYSQRTNGKFDITVGTVVKQWNIGTELAAIPDKDKLAEAVKLVDYERLILDKEKLTAKLLDKGMKVDLGAIAKGYAADEVARVFAENGVKHAIINLGGNVMTIGGNPNGNPWKIGIQDPFNPRGEFLGIVPIKDQTVVTSGTYERFFEVDGKKYHHILDTTTGYPTENNLYSVSIITNKSVDGDGLSTSTLLLGLEEGIKLIESTDNTEAIFITGDKKVYVTSGLKEDFIITNSEFTLAN